MDHPRKLLIVPILHTREDMGSLGNRLPSADGYVAMVSKFWEEAKEKVKRYVDGFERVKVYQDGLPDTQEKLVDRIVSEVQSPNYELLRFLKEKGAKIFGTEPPKLLEEEYKFVKKLTSETKTPRTEGTLRTGNTSERPAAEIARPLAASLSRNKGTTRDRISKDKTISAWERRGGGIGGKAAVLLAQRDAYIANRIDKTLNQGDLGILFLGAAHQIEAKLPKDIQVEIL